MYSSGSTLNLLQYFGISEAPEDRVAATEDAAGRQRVGRLPLDVVCEILPDSLQVAAPEGFICSAHRLDVLDRHGLSLISGVRCEPTQSLRPRDTHTEI